MFLFGLGEQLKRGSKAIDIIARGIGKTMTEVAAGPVKVAEKSVGQFQKSSLTSAVKDIARQRQSDSDS